MTRARPGLMLLLATVISIAVFFIFRKETVNVDPDGGPPAQQLTHEANPPVIAEGDGKLEGNAVHREAIPPDNQPPCRVTGLVLNERREPVIHALVWAVRDGKQAAESETSAGGAYSIDVPPGHYVINARGSETVTSSAKLVVPRGVAMMDGPTLTLEKGSTISGGVYRADGSPFPGLRVRAQAENSVVMEFFTPSGTHIRMGMSEAMSDENGYFHLEGLDADASYTVTVPLVLRKDLHSEPDMITGVKPNSKDAFFTIMADRTLRGHAIDAVSRGPITRLSINGIVTETDNGIFAASIQHRGPISFSSPGYQTLVREDLALEEGETRGGVLIELVKSTDVGSLRLRVVDELGQPLKSIRVQPGFTSSKGPRRSFENLTDGIALIEGLAPGELWIAVLSDRHAYTEVRVTITRGTTTETEVVLPRGGGLTLSVLDEDGAPATVDLAVRNEQGKGPAWTFSYDRPRPVAIISRDLIAIPSENPSRLPLKEIEGRLEGLAAGRYILEVYYEAEPVTIPFEIFPTWEKSLIIRP